MNSVLAIIVTYNRLSNLKECLSALKNQSCKDFDVLVVNNGSTDGTTDFLKSKMDIIAIHQNNLGGAGGFYIGMKYMYEHGYEWLWMMDDDGIPDTSQLEALLKYGEGINGNRVLNALVLNMDKPDELSFNTKHNNTSYYNKFDITDEVFHPFNGTFIHRDVISKIGYIKKEMFIWGDEQEYSLRMRKNGYKLLTVTKAIHYHPKEKGKRINVFPFVKKVTVLDKPRHLSKVFYRNQGFIKNKYNKHIMKIAPLFLFFIANLWRLRFRECFKCVYYYIQGMRNNFSN